MILYSIIAPAAGPCLSSDLRIIFGFNGRKKTIARTQKNSRLVDIVFIGSHVTCGTAQVVLASHY